MYTMPLESTTMLDGLEILPPDANVDTDPDVDCVTLVLTLRDLLLLTDTDVDADTDGDTLRVIETELDGVGDGDALLSARFRYLQTHHATREARGVTTKVHSS